LILSMFIEEEEKRSVDAKFDYSAVMKFT